MKCEIRHRRLYAFYRSKVLNALVIAIIVSFMLIDCTRTMLLPMICGSIATSFFVGYSLWLWIKKPVRVTINNWLSDIAGWFILYFLIVGAMHAANQWWYFFPIIMALLVLIISLFRNQDESFEI